MPSTSEMDGTVSRVRRPNGFTLLELIVVVAIIATLVSVVGPQIFRNVGDAKVNAARSQIEMFGIALESYRLDVGSYPSTAQGLAALRTLSMTGEISAKWRGPYLRRAVPLDPWGREYNYVAPGHENPDQFDLLSFGRDGKAGGAGEDADITSWGDGSRR